MNFGFSLAILAMAVLCPIAPIAHAAPTNSLASGGSGKFEYMSITPENPYVYGRNPNFQHKPVVIPATLLMPANITGKVPAVVLLHGSRGVNKPIYDVWAKTLNDNGIAALVIDTFTPRGIETTNKDQSQLDIEAPVADVYNALKILATHPQIDASKISLIGFSRGGFSAFTANWDSMRKPIIKDDLKFASIVAVYPSGSCTVRMRADRGNTNSNPMLMMFGEKDTSSGGTANCVNYINELNTKSNANITWIEYKGAYHGWDGYSPYHYNQGFNSYTDCTYEVDYLSVKQGLGPARNYTTGEAINGFDEIKQFRNKCIGHDGYAIEGNDKVRAQSVSDALAFVKKSWSR